MDYKFALMLLALVYLFYYSNQTLMNKNTIKHGSINIASHGEETEWIPIGSVSSSMTFQEGSRSVSMASYV
jgi:antitoxin component YwqK of YwqJK toxin-antitoxin module